MASSRITIPAANAAAEDLVQVSGNPGSKSLPDGEDSLSAKDSASSRTDRKTKLDAGSTEAPQMQIPAPLQIPAPVVPTPVPITVQSVAAKIESADTQTGTTDPLNSGSRASVMASVVTTDLLQSSSIAPSVPLIQPHSVQPGNLSNAPGGSATNPALQPAVTKTSVGGVADAPGTESTAGSGPSRATSRELLPRGQQPVEDGQANPAGASAAAVSLNQNDVSSTLSASSATEQPSGSHIVPNGLHTAPQASQVSSLAPGSPVGQPSIAPGTQALASATGTAPAGLDSNSMAPAIPAEMAAGLSNGVKSAGTGPQRTVRGVGRPEYSQAGNPVLNGQVGASDGSLLAHNAAVAHVAAGLPNSAQESPNTPTAEAQSTTSQTFAALDGGTSTGAPTWTHAGAQHAEAGFQDPTLGWVGVRADLSGGGIHAAVMPSSADAAVELGGHLSGLNAYLAEHHTPVESLTLGASKSTDSGAMSQGTGHGSQPGTEQGAGQNSGQGPYAGQRFSIGSDSQASASRANSEVSPTTGMADPVLLTAQTSGVHISVMA
jgi:hypothetical protein